MNASRVVENKLSKEDLKQLVSTKDASITFSKKKEKDRTSKVWSYFSTIFFNNIKQDFVLCDSCMLPIAYKHATGTGGMQKHVVSCVQKSSSIDELNGKKITSYFNSTKNKQNNVPRELKDKITSALTEFIIIDNRPFETVNGKGFINLMDVILSTGRTLLHSSTVSAADLLADPRTLSRRVDRIYEERKLQMKSFCQTLKSFTITVDFWTEKFTGIHFCGVSLHHINNLNQLQSFILACRAYDFENQTSPNVRKFVNQILEEFDLALSSSSFIVSDNENKMKCAFSDVNRVGCSAHYLNKIMEKTFSDTKNVDLKDVQELFSQVKEIVEHVRRCHKQNKLSKKLQTYSKTKFNGAFHMFNVFNEIFDEIAQALSTNSLLTYSIINRQLLRQICDFIADFDEVMEKLCDDSRPTLHRVVPLRQHLIDLCSTFDSDEDDDLHHVKKFIEYQLLTAWIPQDVHLLATIVHPHMKHFDKCSVYKKKAIELLQAEIERRSQTIHTSAISSSSSTASHSFTSTTQGVDVVSSLSVQGNISGTKRKNLLSSCFDQPRFLATPTDELTSWMSSTLTLSDDEDDDILHFWSQNGHLFPTVASIARDVLSIPASNTSVERLFSKSKNLITDKRTKIGVEKIDRLLFLQKNLDIFKNIFDKDPNESEQYQMKRKEDEQINHLFDINSKKQKTNENDEIDQDAGNYVIV